MFRSLGTVVLLCCTLWSNISLHTCVCVCVCLSYSSSLLLFTAVIITCPPSTSTQRASGKERRSAETNRKQEKPNNQRKTAYRRCRLCVPVCVYAVSLLLFRVSAVLDFLFARSLFSCAIHTRTHTQIYIYMCLYLCTYICVY